MTLCELFAWSSLTILELFAKRLLDWRPSPSPSSFSSSSGNEDGVISSRNELSLHSDNFLPPFHRFFFMLGVFTMLGTAFSLYALQLLSFPTWVMFKSCRLIAVVIGSCVILKMEFNVWDYLTMIFMSVGLTLFALGDKDLQISFHPFGLLLVFLSLVMNSLQSNYQQKVMKELNVQMEQVILYSAGSGGLMLLPFLLFTGEFQGAWTYLMDSTHSYELGSLLLTMPLGFVGIKLILSLLIETNAVTCTFVTSTRKALTVVISFLVFPKPFTVKYFIGALLVFSSLFFHLYLQSQPSQNVIEQKVKERSDQ